VLLRFGFGLPGFFILGQDYRYYLIRAWFSAIARCLLAFHVKLYFTYFSLASLVPQTIRKTDWKIKNSRCWNGQWKGNPLWATENGTLVRLTTVSEGLWKGHPSGAPEYGCRE